MPETERKLNFSKEIAWQSGWHAAAYRKTPSQNPWTRADLRQQWEAGWKAWHATPGLTYDEPA
jgi:ribosome modulation factor